MTRRLPIDWRTVAGFIGLLGLIIALGVIGIRQINRLNRAISELGRVEVPLQNAVAEMKSANSQYAQGIRNYIFWRSEKYLDAAAAGGRLDLVHQAAARFDRYRDFYASLATGPQERQWVAALRASEEELRAAGESILETAESLEGAAARDEAALQGALNRQLMDFESALFKIDSFLDDPIQQFNRARIERRLQLADMTQRRSTLVLFWSLIIGLALGAQTAFLTYRRGKKEQEHREFLWRRVIRTEEEERNNLSLQIHDQMGQDLSALKIYLGLVERDIVDGTPEIEKIEKAKKILDVLMEKAHNISELLRPPELDDLGLVESIGALILQHEEMTGAKMSYVRPASALKVTEEDSLLLYRIVQEALTNIAKHSEAKNVEIALTAGGDWARLAIGDDGSGFDYRQLLEKPRRRREDKVRLGLAGLRERVELRGGTLRIDSQPGRGTRIEVALPVG